ncbi:MAG: hypothetical protein ABIG28_01120 [archaeon]
MRKNRFSREQNSLIQVYRENPEIFREISWVADGSKRDALRLCKSYKRNPHKFGEILETAKHVSSLEREEVRHYLMNQGGNCYNGTTKVCMTVGALGTLAIIVSLVSSGQKPIGTKNLIGVIAGMATFLTASTINLEAEKFYQKFFKIRPYREAKAEADRNLGYHRPEGTNQLEFLFNQ